MKKLIGTAAVIATLAPAAPAAAAPALTLRTGKSTVIVGERTRITGRLSGVPRVAHRRISLEVDTWPFEGRFRRVVRGRTDSRGRFVFIGRPSPNTRMRARFGSTTSPLRTVWADFGWRARTRGAGGRHPSLRYTVYASGKAEIRRKRVYAYLARNRSLTYTLIASRHWQHKGRRAVSVTFRYPERTLGKGDFWLTCTREVPSDGYGKPTPLDATCGQPTVTLPSRRLG